MFEYLDHTADVKIRVEANSLDNLFCEAARAYSNLVLNGYSISEDQDEEELRMISLSSESLDALLYDFISELIYLFSTEHFLAFSCNLHVAKSKTDRNKSEYAISGVLKGRFIHEWQEDVKAMTYSELKISEKSGKFIAEFVLDI